MAARYSKRQKHRTESPAVTQHTGMNHLDIPRGMHPSHSFDNLALTNPRIQQLRNNGYQYPRRGSEPFIETPPRSVQNSPVIGRRSGKPVLGRQISKSAHTTPVATRRGLGSRQPSYSDLRDSLPPFVPHPARSRRGSNEELPTTPRSRRGSRDELQTPTGSRRGSRDELQTPTGSRRGSRAELQTPPRSRRGSRDELQTPTGSRRGSPNDGKNEEKSSDRSKTNGEVKSPRANNTDVEKNIGSATSTSPAASPTPPASPTSPASAAPSPARKNCGIRYVLKYLCVIVFLAGVGAIAFVIYQQVSKKNDTSPSTNTTVSTS